MAQQWFATREAQLGDTVTGEGAGDTFDFFKCEERGSLKVAVVAVEDLFGHAIGAAVGDRDAEVFDRTVESIGGGSGGQRAWSRPPSAVVVWGAARAAAVQGTAEALCGRPSRIEGRGSCGVVGGVDDADKFRGDAASHGLEAVPKRGGRGRTSLAASAHGYRQDTVAEIDDRDHAAMRGNGRVDLPLEQAFDGFANLLVVPDRSRWFGNGWLAGLELTPDLGADWLTKVLPRRLWHFRDRDRAAGDHDVGDVIEGEQLGD